MNFSQYIAQRYIFSKSKNNAINIISIIAVGGIFIGALALFVVLSVFSGLREFSLQFTNNTDPDLKVNAVSGKSFYISEKQLSQLKKMDNVAVFGKIIEERVLFTFDGKGQIAYLKGIDNQFTKLNSIATNLYIGNWIETQTNEAVVGYGISQKLSMGLMDFNHHLEVLVPKPGKGQIDSEEDDFNKSTLVPVGIYAMSDELDSKFVFVDIELAQELMGYKPNQISGIELKIKPEADIEKVSADLRKIFDNKVEIKTRAQLNSALYKMLNTENLVLYLIFSLVFIMVLFAFSGAIVMIIIDKKENLKTLLSLGAEVKNLRRIFLYYGVSLCFLGGTFGIIVGTIIVFLQEQFQLVMITETMAYPVVFSFQNVVVVLLTIVFLGFIATLIASSRVSKKLLG